MRSSAHSSRVSLAVVGVLVLLLAVLAFLQYRWIAQLSEAERARLTARLDQATADFCKDFDREVARAQALFAIEQPIEGEDLARALGDRMRDWRSQSTWPEMVKEVRVIRPQSPEDVALLCFDEPSRTLNQCDWDDEFLPIRHSLGRPGRGMPAVDGTLPGLVLAIHQNQSLGTQAPFDRPPPRDHLVIRFDLDFMTEILLPQLAEKHFGSDVGVDYSLTVSSAARPGHIVFQSNAPASSHSGKADAVGQLFGLRSFPDISGPIAGDPHTNRPPPPRIGQQRGDQPQHQNPPPPDTRSRTEDGSWVLAVHHRAGSLEEVVAGARRRNMAISVATLAMLGATALLMMLSTRRAQRLARQQMDFVAAISHELRTPLTAIRSAGQNLADGIIAEPERVRDYGLLIEREGRRLTEMIGRVLTFAGIRSGRQTFRMGPLELANIVEAALADCRWTLDENDFEVDSKIAADLPPVQGDAGALRLVCSNLIDNAIKYGAAGRWLGVTVNCDRVEEPGEIWISVSDHGPGIPRKERQRLFEPFRRGADAASGTVPGSGLGLAVVRGVVEAHGGSIDVSSNSGSGTTFTVRLPVARRNRNQEVSTDAE